MIKPILTEKSMDLVKVQKFSFWVDSGLTKMQIKKLVNQAFGVHATSVRTINYKSVVKKNFKGVVQLKERDRKKAIVTLKKGENIEIFGLKHKKK